MGGDWGKKKKRESDRLSKPETDASAVLFSASPGSSLLISLLPPQGSALALNSWFHADSFGLDITSGLLVNISKLLSKKSTDL